MIEPKPKVLYIDDDLDARTVMNLLLTLLRLDVELARDSGEAIARVGNGQFDLILLELMVGGEPDRFELCRQLRALFPGLPMIVYTGWAHRGQREGAMAAGATDFVAKPDFDGLIASLRRHVRIPQQIK